MKKIAELIIEGIIEKENETYSQEWLLDTVETIKNDKNVVALLLNIDSPGGGVYESDELYTEIKKLKSEKKIPVYAYFGAVAASGGYYIGLAADKIIANRNTLTGSIGVISGEFIEATDLIEKYGVKVEVIHSGRNKAMGHFSERVTVEQREIMQSISDECYNEFVKIVAESRKMSIEEVLSLADGRVYTAFQAKKFNLVDEIAYYSEVEDIIKKDLYGKTDVKVSVTEYKKKRKKSLLNKILKGSLTGADPAEKVLSLVRHSVPFPAYFFCTDRFNR